MNSEQINWLAELAKVLETMPEGITIGSSRDYNFEKADKVYKEMQTLDLKSSLEVLEYAHILCEKEGIPFSDLVLYEQELKRSLKSPDRAGWDTLK